MEIVVRSISPVVRREMRPDEYVLPFMLPQMCARMGCRRTTQHTRIATFRIARSHAFQAQIPLWAVFGGPCARLRGAAACEWRGPDCVLALWRWMGSSPGDKDTSRGKGNMCCDWKHSVRCHEKR